MLCELIEFHGLRVYARFQSQRSENQVDDNGFMEDSLMASGSHGLAKWSFHPDRKKPHLEPWESDSFYYLTGWFRLLLAPSLALAEGHTVHECPARSYNSDGTPLGQFFVKKDIGTDEARIMRPELEEFHKAGNPPNEDEKPLSTRERASLLCIIGALTGHAGIDLTQPHKAAAVIANMLPGDVKLSARTIGEHLKAVSEAMDSRKS